MEINTRANLTCTECGFTKPEEMRADVCQFFYECTNCGCILRPKAGDCCVYCSYADCLCPPKQLEGATDRACCEPLVV